MKKFLVLICLLAIATSANATIVFTASGTSAKGVDVVFGAQLSISGDDLTLVLTNNSLGNTLNPDDTLGSFYFDIVDNGGFRPTLAYTSAVGDLYLVSEASPDVLDTANADLTALSPNKNNWDFYDFGGPQVISLSDVVGGFGIGTVGNSNLTNNFPSMDGVETAIYKGEITTSNLNNKLLVKETATFMFTGLTGFTEADIESSYAFGLGTAPDSLLVVPEPATICLLTFGGLLLRRKRGA